MAAAEIDHSLWASWRSIGHGRMIPAASNASQHAKGELQSILNAVKHESPEMYHRHLAATGSVSLSRKRISSW